MLLREKCLVVIRAIGCRSHDLMPRSRDSVDALITKDVPSGEL